MLTPNFVGVVVGLLFIGPVIWFARKSRTEHWLWAASLVSLPLIYALFGVVASDYRAVSLELIYGMPFLIVGIVFLLFNIKRSAYLLGVFWLAHASYDYWHEVFFVNPGVWRWYPPACAVVDFIVGGYLILLGVKLPGGDLRLANV